MKTLVEFSQAVAADVSGATPDDVSKCCGSISPTATDAVSGAAGPLFGIDILSLVTVIGQLITTLVNNCPQKSKDLAKAASNPTLKQRIQFRAEARSQLRGNPNFRWRDRHEIISSACEKTFGTVNAEDREAIIDDARQPDYSVL